MLVLVVVVGGWLGWIVRCARVQGEAVAIIGKAGGMVEYNWELSNGIRNPNAKPWAPKWLVDRIGIDYFGTVVRIHIGSKTTDAELAQIGRLRDLW